MEESGVDYKVQVSGEGLDTFAAIDSGIGKVSEHIGTMSDKLGKIGNLLAFTALNTAISGIEEAISGVIAPGVALDEQLDEIRKSSDLSSDALSLMKDQARDISRAFGTDVSEGIASAHEILTKINPELAKSPVYLKGMTETGVLMAKQFGGDTAAAVDSLAGAMDSFGLKTGDAQKDAQAFAVIADQMTAASKLGGTSMTDLQAGLEAVGDAAKKSGINFAESTAAINILNKHGIKGKDAGTGLAGVAGALDGSISPEATAALQAAHVDISALSDATMPLNERLAALKPVMNDMSTLTKVFGEDNVEAGKALLNNLDDLDQLTVGIEHSGGALNQYAQDNTSTWDLIKGKAKSAFDNIGIGINDAIGPLKPLGSGIATALEKASQFGIALNGISLAMDSAFIPAITESAVGTWASVAGFTASAAATVSATLATWGFNSALLANPIGVVIAGLLAVGGAVYAVIHWFDEIKDYFVSLGEFLSEINPFHFLWDLVDSVFPSITAAMNETFGKLMEFLGGMWEKLKGIFDTVKGFFKSSLKASVQVDPAVQAAVNEANNTGGAAAPDKPEAKNPLATKLNGVGGDGGNTVRNVNTHINNLVGGNVYINYSDMKTNPKKIKDEFMGLLVDSVRDGEVALGSS